MWAAILLMAWGCWCLIGAPSLAARYRRGVKRELRMSWADLNYPLLSPMKWRAMGVLWLLLGCWWLVSLLRE